MWSIPYPACAQNMVSMKFLSYKLGYIELGGHARFAAPATSRFLHARELAGVDRLVRGCGSLVQIKCRGVSKNFTQIFIYILKYYF
jgi:hypothetical protein